MPQQCCTGRTVQSQGLIQVLQRVAVLFPIDTAQGEIVVRDGMRPRTLQAQLVAEHGKFMAWQVQVPHDAANIKCYIRPLANEEQTLQAERGTSCDGDTFGGACRIHSLQMSRVKNATRMLAAVSHIQPAICQTLS